MRVSKLANDISPSKGRQLFNLASQYHDVINLTLGDPDIITPYTIREAGCNAIMEGKTRYSANAGLIELREKYSNYLSRRYDKSFDPNSEVMVSVGGMEALYLAMLSSINPGDEVIIFAPYYINYYQMIEMCGGIPVVIETTENSMFSPKIEDVERKITSKTKLIIINSPTNPTGMIYDVTIINEILNLAKLNGILIMSDEVYSSLVFGNSEHFSVLDSEIEYKDVLVIDSCSKRFSMTGWRVGFAVGPQEWIGAMIKLQENIAACTPLPSQYAAIKAFSEEPDMTQYISAFENRRNILVDKLSKTDMISFLAPQATFYLFVNISKTGIDSTDFAIRLLKEKKVAVVPGIAYGNNYDNYVRIAFTLEENVLEEAANRIVSFVNELRSEQ